MTENEKIRSLLLKLDTDRMPIRGGTVWVLKDPLGKIYPGEKGVQIAWNTITVAGDKICADANADRGEAQINWMGVGTTSGGKTTASNALEAQVNPRVVCDSRTQGAGAADNDVVWICTFAAGICTGALVEAGLFNDLTAGDMVAYQEFSVINKGVADSLVGTWTIQYGAS